MYSFLKLFDQKVNLINWKRLCSICFPVSDLRSTLGVKKIITSLLDIIKPMNGRRMRGEFPQSGHWCLQFQIHKPCPCLDVSALNGCSSLLQTQPSRRKSGCQDFWELQWSSNCYGDSKLFSCLSNSFTCFCPFTVCKYLRFSKAWGAL